VPLAVAHWMAPGQQGCSGETMQTGAPMPSNAMPEAAIEATKKVLTTGPGVLWRRAWPVMIPALVGLATLPAAAQERPPFPPARDVAVTYRVEDGAGQPAIARLAWSAALRMLRADAPAGAPASLGGVPLLPGTWAVMDLRVGRAFAVESRTGLVLDLPQLAAKAREGERALAGTRARRAGTDRIAGLACTVWRLEPPPGSPGGRRPVRICLTADGVPLRAQEEGRTARAEATAVAYGTQDPALFHRPNGGLAGGASETLGRVLGGGQGRGALEALRGMLGPRP
jgi:hypothetical protein